ncbi:hypothetical protein FC64_GL000709 [Ligilactobacillus araffinosus DSM 20653]|uniref:Uncharacterized protein n=1 Tax=Ligilactobacillus araffinosus DSM 20653 TaxID=1423820 RepID=A0A0R1ZNN8_9LACO|nr:hypothetical protein FC64_GL000709 [Ligilactobacillus araffinosus DSM 20653]
MKGDFRLLDKINNIFYSVIGQHDKEDVKTILSRKLDEIEKAGYSLWAAKIDKKSIEQVWNLKPTDKVYVVCSIKPKAKDPGKGYDNNIAKYYESPKGVFNIDDNVISTFSSKRKTYQAYYVNKYIMLPEEKKMNIGPYKTLLANGQVKTFKERFKCTQFQNTYGKIDDSCNDEFYKEVGLVMELKYPFVVELKLDK